MTKSQLNRIFFIVASILVLGTGTFLITEDFYKEQIKIWDEASSAKNAIDMLKNGNLLVQYDEGEIVRDDYKPPLTLWFKMICYKLFGINEFSVRLPSIIAALFTMFLLWYFGSFIVKKPELGILSALILISSRGYVTYHVARTGDPDSVLIFFVTGAILSFFVLLHNYPKSIKKYLAIFSVFVLLSIYTKSIMGIAPFAGVAIYTLIQKNGRKLLINYRFYISLLAIVLITSIYYIVRELIDPGYLKGVLEYEIFSFNKYPGGTPKHPEFLFYFNYLKNTGFKPYFYFLPVGIIYFFLKNENVLKKIILYSFLGSIAFFIGMSFSTMKNEWYISPIYPFLVLFVSSSFIALKDLILLKTGTNKSKYLSPVLIILIIFISWKPIKQIHNRNHKYENSVYAPEREGRFLRDTYKKLPNIKKLSIVTPYHQRQLKFYTKKLDFKSGIKSKIYKKVPKNIIGDTLLICDNQLIKNVYINYKYALIAKDEYCKLFKIIDIKDSIIIDTIFCNVETLSSKKDTLFAKNDSSNTFSNNLISNKYSFSGNYSVITTNKKRFGLTKSFFLDKSKSMVIVTVWRKIKGSKGYLVLSIPEMKKYTQTSSVIKEENGWEQIETLLEIPTEYSGEEIKAYVWNNSNNDIYFDDLQIIIF
ncbi:MAG: phospholipid carrier-dependent glycosyltransferase [Chlorobi bacterium]|nr:phospholipid carrier-dependent glycosyltransferase [Chlorobiota bacterium]